MLSLSVLVVGPSLTRYPIAQYFLQPATWTYVPSNLLLAKAQPTLPGVLDGFTYSVLNGSLWTLAYEVACYFALLAAGLAGGLTRSRFAVTLSVCLAFGICLSQVPGADSKGFANKMLLLGPAFLAGSAAWVWRSSIPMSGFWAAFLSVAAAFSLGAGLPLAHLLFSVALAYVSIYLALVPAGLIRRFNALGDCSYGVYIYAFPIQQALHYYMPHLTVLGMFLSALLITVALASLSWMYVEKPAIELGKRIAKKSVSKGGLRGASTAPSRPGRT